MLRRLSGLFIAVALSLPYAAGADTASAPKEFSPEKLSNDFVYRKLPVPPFYTFPDGSFAPLKEAKGADALVNFTHPASAHAPVTVGLRILSPKPGVPLAKTLAESGFIQTGDILLSFRPEWGGGGPYTNIQMGISHAGVAYISDGVVKNIDMPLDSEYLGELNAQHYRETKALHVIRPRGLTDLQRSRIKAWAERIAAQAPAIYPKRITFNQDYTSPNYAPGKPLLFVKQLGQLALGKGGDVALKMYCSEFAWALLSLRDCDPQQDREEFAKQGIPACIKPIFTPLPMLGDVVDAQDQLTGAPGLSDGPLLTIGAMRLGKEERDNLLAAVFASDPNSNARMSPGHQKLAEMMNPVFGELKGAYLAAFSDKKRAKKIRDLFNAKMKDNYSPTSYLILALVPDNNPSRLMDYVGTITSLEQ